MKKQHVQFSPGAQQLLVEQCSAKVLFKELAEAQKILDAEYPGLKVSMNSNGDTIVSLKTVVMSFSY